MSTSGNAQCCNDEACNSRLAKGNFFLPANLRASFRSSFKLNTSNHTSRNASHHGDTDGLEPQSVPPRPGLQRRASLRDSLVDIHTKAERRASKVFEMEDRRNSVRNLVFCMPCTEEETKAATLSSSLSTRTANDDVLVSRVGRSHLTASGICCSSEITAIKSILLPIKGVERVNVSPATKSIYVDHDVDIVSASGLCDELNEGGFGASIIKDAAVEMFQKSGLPMDIFVSSSFRMTWDSGVVTSPTVDGMRAVLQQRFEPDHIKNITVDEDKKVLSLEHNPYFVTASQIATVLNDEGCTETVSIKKDGGENGQWAMRLMKQDSDNTVEHQSSRMRVTVIISGVLWVISMLSHIGGNWEYLKYVALVSIAFGLPPIAIKAYRTMRRCKFDVNCMMLFAVIGAVALQDYTEAALVTFLFASSEWLESLATARARNALSAIVSLRPEKANLFNPITNEVVAMPASAVTVGSKVSVRTGDKIPCDAVVIEGSSTVDESNLTGESRPVKKHPGSKVSGGTVNTGSTQLIVRTTATTNNSAVARLIRLVEEAQSNRSETEMLIDSFAQVYTPIVVLTALCMCTIPWAFGADVGQEWLYNGLIVIVIACPCALIISTPVTYVAGLAAAAQKGVMVKGGMHLETVGRTKAVYFDKTGTLSEGLFQLLHIDVIGERYDRKEVLGYLALMEKNASHPLADAIVQAAANESADVFKKQVKDHTLLPGEGIVGVVDGKKVYVGNLRLVDRLGLYQKLSDEDKSKVESWASAGGTTGFISIEGQDIIGMYCVADKIRPEAKDVIVELKKMNIDITMITGDQRKAAIGLGSQIGLKEGDIKSDLLPSHKLDYIREKVEANKQNKRWWQSKQAVMMVGDGVNDAPSLALADVSVAMGEGAALALETSDVTLMDSSLNKLLYIVKMGPRVISIIIANIVFSFAVKALVMGFAFAGKASLWAAIGSDVGAMLVVTLNGMRLLPSSNKVSLEKDGSKEAEEDELLEMEQKAKTKKSVKECFHELTTRMSSSQ